MLAKTLCVAATIATLGFAAPALAGEGSPDIDRGANAPSYGYGFNDGWRGSSPSYSYEVEPSPSQGYVEAPSDPDTGYAAPDNEDDMDDSVE